MPRHKSCIMLSRRSLLKSSTNIKPEVEFKEAATPALLTPAFPRHLDPHRKVGDFLKIPRFYPKMHAIILLVPCIFPKKESA